MFPSQTITPAAFAPPQPGTPGSRNRFIRRSATGA